MRLAGTCSRYSNSAIPQLIRAAMIQGLLLRVFRGPYQAKVMNRLEQASNKAVCSQTGMMDGLRRAGTAQPNWLRR